MEPLEGSSSGLVSISAVSRDTGLSRDTLRIWERRYGFPAPQRDASGERAYPAEQVHKLRVLKRLLDAGHRPGRVVPLSLPELDRLAQAGSAREPAGGRAPATREADTGADTEEPALQDCLEAVRVHEIERLRGLLAQAVLRRGLAGFVTALVAPLNVRIGEAWMRGQLQVFEEHLYTEAVQGVLRHAIASLPPPSGAGRPRVLLGTLPGEPHGLGLLMVEAMFAIEGCRVVSLGVQTPLQDIVMAARAQRADIVGLSFTASQNPAEVLAGLAQLRAALPPACLLWAGGAAPVLQRRPPPDVTVVGDLRELPAALRAWRPAG